MADHLDEPPQKKVKKDPFQGPDSSSEYFSSFLIFFILFLKSVVKKSSKKSCAFSIFWLFPKGC